MSETTTTATSNRATIIVAYGAFGLDVLRRLLASTALRGVLRWREPAGGASPSERRLQDLSLLWVPDRLDLEDQRVDHQADTDGSLEMFRDLYRQICQVPEIAKPEDDLAKAMLNAAETLLSAADRNPGGEGADPLGLDVIVVARPTCRAVVGLLDRMIARGMDALANNTNLQRAVQGAEVLNFVGILDFESYWDRRSDVAREVREALQQSVERWQRRRSEQLPAYARLYLVDGRTADGFRSPRVRIEEISLFLELLLFEGQRADLQLLYQAAGAHEPPIATFGIRLLERSAGLLSRLAAAHFGFGWLDYLTGNEVPPGSEPTPSELRRELRRYQPAELDRLLARQQLQEDIAGAMRSLEQQLLALPEDDPAWPLRVRDCYQECENRLHDLLLAKTGTRMSEIRQELLLQQSTETTTGEQRSLTGQIEGAIEAELHHARHAVPLGSVIDEVTAALRALEGEDEVSTPPAGEADAALQGLAHFHTDFLHFSSQRVHAQRLKQWWLLLAMMLAAAVTPIAVELLEDLVALVPKPDATKHWLTIGYELLQYLPHPLLVLSLVLLTAWGLGATSVHKRIAARLDRARRFFSDPERGRFADSIKAALAPGGALRAPSEQLLNSLLHNMRVSIRSEVRRQLGRIAARLEERRREMLWLRQQLRAFLKVHGVETEGRDQQQRLGQDETRIRHSIALHEDFEQMLASNPPGPERFRSAQCNTTPFTGWKQRYSDAFLYPLSFIERLSRTYRDPFQDELSQPGAGPEQERRARDFISFLGSEGSFSLAFSFQAQEGLTTERSYCLLPAVWRRLPGIELSLNDRGVTSENVLTGTDVARAYLLRLRTGVDPRCLVEES